MRQTIHISTPVRNGLYDITSRVETIVAESGVQTGLVNVYVQGATAGIMEQFKFITLFQQVKNTAPIRLHFP